MPLSWLKWLLGPLNFLRRTVAMAATPDRSAPRRREKRRVRPCSEQLEDRVTPTGSLELIKNGAFSGIVSSSDWATSGNFHADSRFFNYHSSPGYAYLSNADGSKGNNLVGEMYQQITIPASSTSTLLTYWYNITSDDTGSVAHDVLNITVRNTSGTYLGTVGVYSNLNRTSGYQQASYDLSAFKGQTIRLDFFGTTDASLPTVFRIDDVSAIATIPNQVVETFYVHNGSAIGPLVSGAQISGQDSAGQSFSQTTDTNGYAKILGAPGQWQLKIEKAGYVTNSWQQPFNSDGTYDPFFLAMQPVTLTLYVHNGSETGPILRGVVVTGQDAAGQSFNQTTNASGYVTLTGTPGTWQFTIQEAGYQTKSWPQAILADGRRDAFFFGPPPAPSQLNAVATDNTSILVSWPGASTADSYSLYRAASDSGPWNQTIYAGSTLQHSDTGLNPLTTYYYRVVASNSVGDSNLSSVAAATTPANNVPPIPTDLTATSNSPGTISLAWDNVLTTGTYVIQRANTVDGVFNVINSTSAGTSHYVDSDTSLAAGITYYYRVQSVTGGVPSPWSPVQHSMLVDGVQVYPAISAVPQAWDDPGYENVAKLYRWTFQDPVPSLWEPVQPNEIDWSKRTIILTHGWNSDLASSPWIKDFALNLEKDRSPDGLATLKQEYNIIAVDWSDSNQAGHHGRYGSDPNGLPSFVQDFLDGGLLGMWKDANVSSQNAIRVAQALAIRLVAAGIDPGKTMLIGHSNGAGFMGSLARTIYGQLQERIAELTALDAPIETQSYIETKGAAVATDHITNVFLPLGNSFAGSGFGSRMTSVVGDITNYQLNADETRSFADPYPSHLDGHGRVADRYALTAARGSSWGFSASYFATGNVVPSSFTDGVEEIIWHESPSVSGLFTAKFETFSEPVVDLTNAVVNGTRQIWDDTVRVEANIQQALKGYVGSTSLWLSSLTNSIYSKGHSPVYSSVDVSIPQDARLLRFDLTVLDPGNPGQDMLQVAIGNQVIGDIDLSLHKQSGDQTVVLWMGDYAGQTTSVNVYMPSTSAEFVESNIEFMPLNFLPKPAMALINQSDSSLAVTKAGKTASYTVALASQPTADVTVAVSPDSQLTVSPASLTFTPDNWDLPQVVTVAAVDDHTLKGNHIGTIGHATASSDPNFDGIQIGDLTVNILEDPNPATRTTLGVSASSFAYGQPVVLTATVTVIPPNVGTPDGGTVTFIDGGNTVGSATVSAGIATLTTTSLALGSHSFTASYSGYGLLAASTTSIGSDSIIGTFAGNGSSTWGGDNGPATAALMDQPQGIAVDSNGNIFIADAYNNRIRRVDASTGIITTVAGNGTAGFGGDHGPATAASLNLWTNNAPATSVAVDASGHLFIADTQNNRVREVDLSTGLITTFAGNGTSGFSGDYGLATAASLSRPVSVAVDANGNLYITDDQRIRKVTAATGVITTIAGNGSYGYNGDGGLATAAMLKDPAALAVDGNGNIFIADSSNNRIRKVTASTGVITTVAGNGSLGYSGDGGPATAALLYVPTGVAVDSSGNIFIADEYNHRVRKVTVSTGVITTIAGNGAPGYGGDGGAATAASLNRPDGIAIDANGHLLISDYLNNRIRKVDLSAGTVSTVAGGLGDNGLATTAALNSPVDVAADSSGNLFFVDRYNNRIRKVHLSTGMITGVAGNGTQGFAGDNGPATAASLSSPMGVAVDADGNVFIADAGNNRVREVNHSTGLLTTIAGNGTAGFSGDNGPATGASLNYPKAVTVDAVGHLYISDQSNSRVRRVDLSTGVITTVAGNGSRAFDGDGGQATAASIGGPAGIAVDATGNLFIVDQWRSRIREVNLSTGVISTVAGNGNSGYSGDNGPATAASFYVNGIAVDTSGHLFIADFGNNRIRKVDLATGIITTVVGEGTGAYSGDDAPAAAAEINGPFGVAVDSQGNLFIADSQNNRVREVKPGWLVTIAQAATSTHVTSSPSPSAYAQSVTFTATVTPSSGVAPTGTVQFQIDGSNAGSPVPLSGSVGTYSTSTLAVGSHSIVAVYNGDGNFTGSTSSTFNQGVVPPITVAVNAPGSAMAGTAFSGMVATFTDTDATASAASFSATITWGNGQTTSGTISGGSGSFTVSGSTTYAQEGRYPFTVTVTDATGNTFTGSGLAHVARVGPPPAGLSFVAHAFSHSVEYYQNIVTVAYRKYLGRDPEPTGLAGWVNALQGGYSDERLEAGFIGSPEYIADHGGTGAAWIIGMYRDLLGRDPDAAGLQGWENALAGGLDPAAIAYGFAASPEREAQRISADYQKYLGRPPESADVVQRWVNAFEGGYSNEDLVALFAGSLEYFQRHSGNAQDWLFSAYRDVLNRAPDNAGFQGWLQFLNNS